MTDPTRSLLSSTMTLVGIAKWNQLLVPGIA